MPVGSHDAARPRDAHGGDAATAAASDPLDALARELDGIRDAVRADLGAGDRAYITGVITAQRQLELAGRALLIAARFAPAAVLGTTLLSLSKILENMEIGHNVLHGQWDWMRDPAIHSGELGVGLRLDVRVLEARSQLPPPRLHERPRS